jgi:hypothetical protein
VSVPGPGLGAWTLGLLVFAAASAVVGGAVRTFALRWVRSWRSLGPVERLVLNIYLGGALVYAVAVVPLGLFTAATFPVLLGVSLAYLLYRVVRLGRAQSGAAVDAAVGRFLTPGPAIALAAAAALGFLELAVAIGVPTGNTYDASQLATYTTLLLAHHSIPTTLAGAGLSAPVVYPQGASVWMGTAQLLFGLPPARTAVLVTPLFLGLAPLGGYVLGDRWLGGERAGAVFAVVLALVATWTRMQVSGSYDFVAAFPLTLLLIALSRAWIEPTPLPWSDVAAFGLVAGYAAALSPVGIVWWMLALPVVAGAAVAGRWFGSARAWFGRYGLAVGAAAVPVAPSLWAVARGLGHIGFAATAPGIGTLAPVGLTGPQIVAYADPFLFGPTSQGLSPFSLLRDELAVLLVAGLLVLVLPALSGPFGALRRFVVGGLASAAAWFLVEGLASGGVRPFASIAPLTNGSELSEMLFTLYVLLATVPIVVLLERGLAVAPAGAGPHRRWSLDGTRPPPAATAALAVGLLLLVPGVAVTTTEVPGTLGTLYHSFGNVSADDFAMLAWAAATLPPGTRVLVAPGSAAEFLTAEAPELRVVFPMVLGFSYPNATYRDLDRELENGTLAPNGTTDLAVLGVGFVVVTGANTVLGDPYDPTPLLADPSGYPLVYHSGDAYVFAVAAATDGGTVG